MKSAIIFLAVFCLGHISTTQSRATGGGPTPADHCVVSPVSNRQQHTVTVETKRNCTNGSIWWNYPQNELKVSFHMMDSNANFIACIKYIQERQVHNIFDLTGGMRKLLRLPPKGGETCSSHSVHGTATLMFMGPNMVESYIAFIDYQLKRS